MCGASVEAHSRAPETLLKLYASAKFPHQEIR